MAAETAESGAIFGTSGRKTQHADTPRKTPADHDGECCLLDRNGEPCNQPRDLVEMIVIMSFNRLS